MLGKRTRPASSSSQHDSPLTPPKRALTAHLAATKPIHASPTSTAAKRTAAGASSAMRRTGSQKENVGLSTTQMAAMEEDDAHMESREEKGKPDAPTPSTPADDLFDPLPSTPAPSSLPSADAAASSSSIPNIYAHASLLLSTSSTSASSLALSGRADQRETLLAFLSRRFPAVYAPSPSASSSSTRAAPSRPGPASMYVSGPPGIGKTALLLSVLGEFERHVQEKDLEGEVRVHMENCASVGAAGSDGAWGRLAKGLGVECEKRRRNAKEAFEEGLKDGRKYLLILDEIDHLVSSSSPRSSASPDLLNSLFALASIPASPLTLIGIANDLTLKALSLTPPTTPTKATSGKGKGKPDPLLTPTKPIRLHFKPYSWQELVAIVAQRLALLAPSYPVDPSFTPSSPAPGPSAGAKPSYPLIAPPALERLCKKIATTTGDVRTVLSLARACIAQSTPALPAAELAALTPASAPKAGMPHLSRALAQASFAGSGLAPPPSLSKRLDALKGRPQHWLALAAVVISLSRALPPAAGGLACTSQASEGARVPLDIALRVYRDTVVASSDALRATQLDGEAFREAVGMVEDLTGAVVVRGRAGGDASPSKGKTGRRTPTKRVERGVVTVELAASAPMGELVEVLSRAPAAGEEGKEEEAVRLVRRVLEGEKADQARRVRWAEMGRNAEKRAEDEEMAREWERKVLAAEAEKV
ncbi:hypothetical protein JCM10207_007777 [Rhodosporidiobolus poonsookiae]